MQAMSDKTYNGWTNYETWGVALVLNNDQGLQEVALGIAREGDGRADVADALRDLVENLCGLSDDLGVPEPSLMARQLLGAALSATDWYEIAGHFIEDADES